MIALDPRPLTPTEVAVIVNALRRAPFGAGSEVDEQFLANELRVVGRCDCGCASIFFVPEEWRDDRHRVADGAGETADGEHVTIIVWANSTALAHLELVSYSDRRALLPVPSSTR
ncbi:hypothetical protein [Hydrogenophaga sp.]|uniref:hypothetical protein n=1 Tax=Hydrogenophaga sp. TaxID=1904254 RepID=UPI0027249AC9|nr:hypothetical protein [Hydrogenophaga sp.]MDO9439163.1 hypothetical protein [Hydrogenophaga sp.]